MEWPYKHFTIDEMRCKCGECNGLPRASFMEKLEAIREELNEPMVINSGYRCPKYNSEVAHTGTNGPHTIGAADIRCVRPKTFNIVELAIKHGMTGIGVKQNGSMESRYVHLDDVHLIPDIWSY